MSSGRPFAVKHMRRRFGRSFSKPLFRPITRSNIEIASNCTEPGANSHHRLVDLVHLEPTHRHKLPGHQPQTIHTPTVSPTRWLISPKRTVAHPSLWTSSPAIRISTAISLYPAIFFRLASRAFCSALPIFALTRLYYPSRDPSGLGTICPCKSQ